MIVNLKKHVDIYNSFKQNFVIHYKILVLLNINYPY